ncbi:MAG: XisI protein [Xenococcaceae cyanobacterium]
MARIDDYRKYVEEIIKKYGQYKPSYGDVEVQLVLDRERDHYHLMTVGWDGYERIRGSLLHIDIKEGKIWIQHDGTEEGVAKELLELGVPKEDIVLAFHAPYKRKYTGFALG